LDRRNVAQQAKKALFLSVFPEEGTVSHAAKRVGIDRVTHYRWLQADPEYAAAFATAELEANDNMEREARRRAVEGTEEPVYQGGKKIGTIRKYSDTLLIFLMKAAMPSKYRERVDVSIDIRHAVERLTTDPAEREAAMAEVDRILAEAKA
jgi:transposase-like protein